MFSLCKKGKQDGKLYSGEKSRKSPSPNEPTPRPTKKLERGDGMKEAIITLSERVKFHEEQLNYMMTTTREMYMHEGAIKELMVLIDYIEQNYDSMP